MAKVSESGIIDVQAKTDKRKKTTDNDKEAADNLSDEGLRAHKETAKKEKDTTVEPNSDGMHISLVLDACASPSGKLSHHLSRPLQPARGCVEASLCNSATGILGHAVPDGKRKARGTADLGKRAGKAGPRGGAVEG